MLLLASFTFSFYPRMSGEKSSSNLAQRKGWKDMYTLFSIVRNKLFSHAIMFWLFQVEASFQRFSSPKIQRINIYLQIPIFTTHEMQGEQKRIRSAVLLIDCNESAHAVDFAKNPHSKGMWSMWSMWPSINPINVKTLKDNNFNDLKFKTKR